MGLPQRVSTPRRSRIGGSGCAPTRCKSNALVDFAKFAECRLIRYGLSSDIYRIPIGIRNGTRFWRARSSGQQGRARRGRATGTRPSVSKPHSALPCQRRATERWCLDNTLLLISHSLLTIQVIMRSYTVGITIYFNHLHIKLHIILRECACVQKPIQLIRAGVMRNAPLPQRSASDYAGTVSRAFRSQGSI
jgi:hypothetical protein